MARQVLGMQGEGSGLLGCSVLGSVWGLGLLGSMVKRLAAELQD